MPLRVLAGVIGAVGVSALTTGFGPLFVVTYAIIAGTALAYSWALLQATGLGATIELLDHISQAGSTITVRLVLTERFGVPRHGIQVRLAGSDPSDAATVDIRSRQRTTIYLALHDQPRGARDIGPVIVTSTDPMRIAHIDARLGDAARIVVYPRTFSVSGGALDGLTHLGGSGASWRAMRDPTAASALREYVFGDPPSRIHWPTSARLGHLITRQPDGGETVPQVWVVLDLNRRTNRGSGDESTEEYGVTITASLIAALLDRNIHVGLLAAGNRLLNLPANTGPTQRSSMLEALATIRAWGRVSLADLLAEHGALITQDACLVLVGPRPAGAALDAAAPLVRSGTRVVQVWVDGNSFNEEIDNSVEVASTLITKDTGIANLGVAVEGLLTIDLAESQPSLP
jgi:uncharacterized protein (DUF58 family)